jgi:hypothetical protein
MGTRWDGETYVGEEIRRGQDGATPGAPVTRTIKCQPKAWKRSMNAGTANARSAMTLNECYLSERTPYLAPTQVADWKSSQAADSQEQPAFTHVSYRDWV